MIRNIKNISQTEVVLNDMLGKVLAVDEVFDGLSFGNELFLNSTSVQVGLLDGKLSLNDGFLTYTGQAAVDLIRGYASQKTKDGKEILVASDRPKDHYRHFTGNGDDIVSTPNRIGKGAALHLIGVAEETKTVEAHFVDDVYIKDGTIQYRNCGFDSHFSVDIICPPNIPFPSPTKTGTLDLVGGTFVANTTGTGLYMTVPAEVKLFKFINEIPIVEDGTFNIQSTEPFLLNKPYFIRLSLTVAADTVGNAKAAVTLGVYRKVTV